VPTKLPGNDVLNAVLARERQEHVRVHRRVGLQYCAADDRAQRSER
jgi:hypothetical protein